MKLKNCLAVLCFCLALTVCGFSTAEAQTVIKGTITSNTGTPLSGVSVHLNGSNKGVIADSTGHYQIQVEKETKSLVFSFVGYLTKEVATNGRQIIDVVLEPAEGTALNEVVVIGYGKRQKANLTGAVATVSGKELEKSPVANLSNAIAGAVPGIIANTRSGEPGADGANILIRGKGTLGSTAPLIVIDGVPDREGGFSRLNPADIASFTVLKDATAAIYGARAANGVILITTKRGQAGNSTLSFTTNWAMTQPTRVPKMLNSAQYAQSVNEYNALLGQQPTYSQEDIQKYADGSDPLGHPNTNWWKSVMKNWSDQQNELISLRGGSDKIKYFISGQYLNQNSMYKSGKDFYKNRNVRANMDIQATKNFKIGIDVLYRNEYKESAGYGGLFYEFWNAYPYLVPVYPNGKVGVGIDGGPNNSLVYILDNQTGQQTDNYDFLQTKTSFSWDLSTLTKGLQLDGYYAYDLSYHQYKFFDKTPPPAYSYNVNTGNYDAYSATGTPSLNINNDKTLDRLFNIKLGWERLFGKHHLEAFVAYEQSQRDYTLLQASRKGFLSNTIAELFAGGTDGILNNSSTVQAARQNYISRLSYNYDNRYLIDYSMRYDGSANFAPGKRFGFFPSISGAWRISNEKFFHSGFFNDLKLRASWGETGNDAVSAFQYLQNYILESGQDPNNKYLGRGYEYGNDATQAPGFSLGPTPNLDITWERASQTNIGIDATMLNNALSVSLDIWQAARKDILGPPTAVVPDYTGITLPDENYGKVNSHGLDFDAHYNKSVNQDFSYFISGNFTYATNKIKYIAESANVPDYQKSTGYPMDSWFVYESDGLYQTQQEVDNSPHPEGSGPGDIKYIDQNGDGEINDLDKIRLTKSNTPQILYGLTFGGNYKNFDFSVFFQGQAAAQALLRPSGLNMAEEFFVDRWQKQGDNKYPRTFNGPTSRTFGPNTLPSDFWLRNDGFLRLKNVEIGYNFPKTLLDRLKLQRARFYINGNNLLSIDDFGPSFDPEAPSGTSTDGRYYPQQRVINFGLNLTF
ncbi:TonB-dependent receptor [Arachidicoccus ginsenosidivorans]